MQVKIHGTLIGMVKKPTNNPDRDIWELEVAYSGGTQIVIVNTNVDLSKELTVPPLTIGCPEEEIVIKGCVLSDVFDDKSLIHIESITKIVYTKQEIPVHWHE